ncbi:unnamed protein product [Leptidea sinapis]|uniref:Uncharacterized protein n=1 Tax=Leptidea sinapis TaxID=189913 RepID=A0A5E4QRW5_9NEOP|nr:unnamed protein product [Leptidea sinapis]
MLKHGTAGACSRCGRACARRGWRRAPSARARARPPSTSCSEAHVHAFGGRSRDAGGGGAVRLVRLACGGLGVDADTAWSEAHTPAAARTAAGARRVCVQ